MRVNGGDGTIVFTDVDGEFPIKVGWDMVHFSRPEYRAELRSRHALTSPIVMVRTMEKQRFVPYCASGEPADGSGRLRIPTAPDVRRTSRGSTDSVHVHWRYGSAVLAKGSGATWSGGLPDAREIAGLRDVVDHELLEPEEVRTATAPHESPVIDYRGMRSDGRRFRFVGRLGETYVYDRVSPADAAIFDRMLDAVCYVFP